MNPNFDRDECKEKERSERKNTREKKDGVNAEGGRREYIPVIEIVLCREGDLYIWIS
jgi:hypothetical protein